MYHVWCKLLRFASYLLVLGNIAILAINCAMQSYILAIANVISLVIALDILDNPAYREDDDE